jgi:hypothetical protein
MCLGRGLARSVLLVVLIALLDRLSRGSSSRGGPTYLPVDSILSAAELEFFSALRQAAPAGFYICCKPRLGDLVIVPNQEGRDNQPEIGWIGSVSSRYVDDYY